MSGFWLIPDGFTLPGKIIGTPGSLRTGKFKYRLCGPLETTKVSSARSPEAIVDAKADVAAKFTAEWEVQNDDGSWTPEIMTADKFKALPAQVLETAYAYVIGTLGPSIEEEAGKSPAASG